MEELFNWALTTALASPWAGGTLVGMAAVGTLYTVAKVIVKLTPSTADDKFMEKLEKIPVLGQLLRASSKFSKIKPK